MTREQAAQALEALSDQGEPPALSLVEKVANELRHNDACGPGPVSDDEYMDDARAILRIVDDHQAAERARFRERLKDTQQWRACGTDNGSSRPDVDDWHDEVGAAHADLRSLGRAVPPYDHTWMETRWVSAPERVETSGGFDEEGRSE